MKWLLIIYLGYQGNYAVVDEFATRTECFEKHFMYQKALSQANSEMNVECVRATHFTM